MKYVYVIPIFISSVLTRPEILNIEGNEYSDIDINNLVDRAIPQISQFIINNGLDPLNLPQTEKKLWTDLSDTTISNEIEPMIYKANLILHSGILKHLSNLKRYGDATLNYKDQVLRLDVGFEFTLLQGTYDFIVDMVFVNLKGRILVSAVNVRAKTIVTYNSMNHILSLDKFELQVPGSIKVIIENKNGGVDWINTFIANIVTPFFKNTIVSSVQEEAANAIRAHFDEISQAIVEGKLVTPVFEYGSTKA